MILFGKENHHVFVKIFSTRYWEPNCAVSRHIVKFSRTIGPIYYKYLRSRVSAPNADIRVSVHNQCERYWPLKPAHVFTDQVNFQLEISS